MSTPSKPNIRVRPKATNGTLEFWWAPPDSDGGSPVTEYVIAIPGFFGDTVPYTVGYYKMTGFLTNGIPYTAQVIARNANGDGAIAIFRTVEPGNLPGPMNAVTTTRDASGVATFSWTAPTSDGGATIGWNKLSLIPIRSDLPTKFYNTVAAETSITVTDLSANESYIVLVEPRNDPGFPASKQVLTPTLTFGTRPEDISGFTNKFDSSDISSLYIDSLGEDTVGYNSAVDVRYWSSQSTAVGNVSQIPSRFVKNGIRNGVGPYYPTLLIGPTPGSELTTFAPLSSRNEVSLYFYFEYADLSNNQYIFSGDVSILLDRSRGTDILFNCDGASGGSLAYTSGPVLAGMYADLSNVTIEVYHPVNQVLVTTTRSNTVDFSTPSVWALGTNAVDVRISEIAMFNRVLTGTDKTNVLSYFERKWGFTIPPP